MQRSRSVIERIALICCAILCGNATAVTFAMAHFIPGMAFAALGLGIATLACATEAFSDKTVRAYCDDHQPTFFVRSRPVCVKTHPQFRRTWNSYRCFPRPRVLFPAQSTIRVNPRPPVYSTGSRSHQAHRPPVYTATESTGYNNAHARSGLRR